MTELIILITAVTFYYIGKVSTQIAPTPKEVRDKLLSTNKNVSTKPKKYLSLEERKIKGTPEEEVNKLMRETFKQLERERNE